MSNSPGQRVWPTLDRTAELASLRKAIAEPGKRGVVVTGETGSGKTTLALAAADGLLGDVVLVHGSESGRTIPYAALHGLVVEGGGPAPTDPAGLAAVVTEVLQRRSVAGEPVVIVDPAPHLDEQSSHVLAQIAKAGTARLVVLGRLITQMPEPLREMWRDGLLGEHVVAPWSVEEVAELLTRHLGAPVVLWTVQELARIAAHQPLFLRFVVEEQLRAGRLVHSDGTWLLGGTPTFDSVALADELRARLDERTDAERDVLDLVALADGLPYDALEQMADPVALDSLLDAGVLRVEPGPGARVVVAHPTVAVLTRSGVPFQRRRRLRARLVEHFGGRVPDDGPDRLAYLAWTLDAGASVEPDAAIAAAAEANRLYAPELALRLVTAVGGPATPSAVVAAAHARRLLGDVAAAGRSVGEHARAVRDPEDLALLAGEMAVAAAIAVELIPGAYELLDRAIAVNDDRSRLRLLGAARFDLLASEGRYVEMVSELEAAVAQRDSSEAWIIMASRLAEAWCLTGRQVDALALVDEIGALLPAVPLSAHAIDVGYGATYGVLLKCGLWSSARSLIDAGSRYIDLKMLVLGAAADSALGITLVLGGRAREARPLLAQALTQARVRDPRRTRGQTAAGLAAAAALLGEEAVARTALVDAASREPTFWNVGASADYLTFVARLAMDGTARTEVDLLALAAEYRRRGMVADELLVLSLGARAGSQLALERLREVEMTGPGPLAVAVSDWVDAVDVGDAEALIAVAGTLLDIGNPSFARDVARQAAELGGPSAARARVLIARAGAELEGPTVATPFSALTPREREVCERAASGATNREIAAALVLSVRTVESYLQTAFAKLGVSGRSELAALVDD